MPSLDRSGKEDRHMAPKAYVAKETFFTEVHGEPYKVEKGRAYASDHPAVKGRAELFDPLEDVDVEQAPQPPKKKAAPQGPTKAASRSKRKKAKPVNAPKVERATAGPGEKRGKPAGSAASRSEVEQATASPDDAETKGLTTKSLKGE